ncbi:MAG: long-chain-fatty-acid--CoA ligase [Proteobacteria bacterium]|nr:long-chain-fatty-acid--CoA ligase [Pseudomonadota bacterium]
MESAMRGLMMETPLLVTSLVRHAAINHGGREIVSRMHDGAIHRTDYAATYARIQCLANALRRLGVAEGDRIATIAWNSYRHFEIYFAAPGIGAVCHTINPRLFGEQIVYIANHAEDRLLFLDLSFLPLVEGIADRLTGIKGFVLMCAEDEMPETTLANVMCYESLLAGEPDSIDWPELDERTASSLCYTSGTTGNPKGVVYHHRGAYLNALGNIQVWGMGPHPVYLWTLPMFHCNGWCFPWAVGALAGTNICLRKVEAGAIYAAFAEHGVTHLCGAPIVMQTILGAREDERRPFDQQVRMMTAAAPPPAAVLAAMAEQGIEVTHVYGLTEVYGPAVVCAWHREWDALPGDQQAALKARQGVKYPVLEGLMVADPKTLEPVPKDGATMGEVFLRGNIVMKGYLKNPSATKAAFDGGWFHSGDLGVWHADGYIELKDRSKDIIISGGENISSIEVEGVLYRHPAVAAAAVVAKPDRKWGETPCAFIEVKPGAEAEAAEIIAFCRDNMAHFKAPKHVVFGPLPKTSTGKIQKYVLRERAKEI